MTCPRCQTVNNETAKFCSNCGQPLEAQAAQRRPEGERKLVTVLFADVVGSTAMGEQLDPEMVTELMNGAFAFMNAAVDRYGGIVSRLMGDAVLAIFGAPNAHEDDAERAVRAGLEILASAGEYATGARQQYGVDFNVRVGIHTGLAVLDLVGDRVRTEYTAMGDTPNLAARLQSAAAPGSGLVSADTYGLTRHAFDYESRGALEVKGKAAPVEVWRIIGPRAVPASPRGLAGLRAPMVGREAEMGRLLARLHALRTNGKGGWVAVTGEAGLGKSRLLAELRQASADEPAEPGTATPGWLEGRCISYGQSTSYLPWRQIIRQSLGAQDDDSAEAVRAKLEYNACVCCDLPGGDVPFLEAMLAVASDESLKTVRGYSGDALVERMTDAVRGYLCGLAQIKPQVIVFEDLHWADDASLALLENVAELVPEHALLFICLMRPDKDTPAWAASERARGKLDNGYLEELALGPLSQDQSRSLLGLLLHIEDLPDHVRAVILERAEGNPFFVEEVIRALLDSGHIVREAGYWRATRAIETVAIPNTLAGLLAARIDVLPNEAKRVAQMAAVIGRSFLYRVIKTVCASAPAAERIEHVKPPLDVLGRQEIVQVRAQEPELEYAFKHVLTQEAAYNSLLLRRRREFHGRAGEALQSLYGDRLDEIAPTLSHHYWQAEAWAPAATFALRAGQAALKVHALRESIRQFERAIAALDKAAGHHDLEVYEAIMGWAQAAFKFRPYPEQLELLGRAEQIARRQDDSRRLAQALHAIGTVYIAHGRGMRAMPVFNEAFELAEEIGDEELATIPSYHAAFTRMDSDPQAAMGMFDQAIELAVKHGDRDQEAYALSAKAIGLARLGRSAESQEALNAALDIVKTLNSPVTESDVELFAGWSYLDMNDPPAALKHGQRGVDLAVATDNFDCICGGLVCVGLSQMQTNQVAKAAASFRQAIEQTKISGAVRFEIMARGGLAITQLISGVPDALVDLEQAAARAREVGDPYTDAVFTQSIAEARLAQGDLPGAQFALDKALAYFERNAMHPYIARARALQAELAARADEARRA